MKKEITLNQLNRILSIIKSEKGIEKKELKKVLGMTKDKFERALNFLKRNNLIMEKKNGTNTYFE